MSRSGQVTHPNERKSANEIAWPRQRLIVTIITILLFFSALLALGFWQWCDVLPSGGDGHAHLAATLAVARASAEGSETLRGLLLSYGANHMPLLYLTAAGLLRSTGGAPASLDIPIVGFWAIACLAFLAFGMALGNHRFFSLLPFATFLVVPTFWEVGCSYSLEVVQIANVAVLMALFFNADRLQPLGWLFAAVLIAAFFSLSRATALWFIVPGGLLLCFENEWAIRLRRLSLLLAAVLPPTIWIGLHADRVASEYTSLSSSARSIGANLCYYWKVILIDYRGFPLVITLAVLLFLRFRQKDWHRLDATFFVFIAAPLAFFFLLKPQVPRYILPAYLALSGWTLFSARRIEEKSPWARNLVTAITVIYIVVGFFTTVTVALAAGYPGPGELLGIRRAALTPSGLSIPEAREKFGAGLAAELRGEKTADLDLWLLAENPKDLPARLHFAETLARQGNLEQSQREFDVLFSPLADFGMKVEALTCLASLAAAGFVPAKEFDRRLVPLLAENQSDQARLYTLRSAKVRACQLAHDWPAALEAVRLLRSVLIAEQEPGVNLVEASIREAMGDNSQARRLLEENLRRIEPDDPVYTDSLLALAKIAAGENRFDEAEQRLMAAAKTGLNQNGLASVTMSVAGRIANAGQINAGESLLIAIADRLSGQPAALLQVELAKSALARNDYQTAESYLRRARRTAEDPKTILWIEDSIKQIQASGR
ncbi:MAG: hypothetical protein GX444_20100 [Myxococcales bacterium]|nr:hypothetical protein [Myxococcales bacterium]